MPTLKQFYSFLLLAFSVLALSACGDDDNGGGGTTGPDPDPDPDPDPEKSIGIEMVRIEPGTYMRGDDFERSKAQPFHQVTITKPFMIGKYEFLGSEYDKLMGEELSGALSDRHPHNDFSWLDAFEICNQLSEYEELNPVYTIVGEDVTWNRSANGYRLPTEAEWEYACRAGTSTSLYNGNIPQFVGESPATHPLLDAIAWYYSTEEFPVNAKAVGLKEPNSHGLYDMFGNIHEMTWDRFGPYSADPLIDPSGPDEGEQRIARGGNIRQSVNEIRAGYRWPVPQSEKNTVVGMRVARNTE